MKRGDIWTVSGGQDYAGKPRPAVVLQDDAFSATSSVTLCFFTTDRSDTPVTRPAVEPTEQNGLRSTSRLMVDKISTVPRGKVGQQIGRLSSQDTSRLNRALLIFLGLARPIRASARRNVDLD